MNKKPVAALSVLCLLSLCSCGSQSSSQSSCSCSTCEPASSQSTTSSEPTSEPSSEPTSEPTSESSTSLEPEPESKISLHKADSRFVLLSYVDGGSFLLPTYHHADYGEVPYVEAEPFFKVLSSSTFLKGATFRKLADHLYAAIQNGVVLMTFNPETDIVDFLGDEYVESMSANNRGVTKDTCAPNDGPTSCLHTSPLSKILRGPTKEEIYDFGAYDFDMVEEDDHLYFAFQPVSSLLFRQVGLELAYNGLDFFASTTLTEALGSTMPGGYSSFYASEKAFAYQGKVFYRSSPLGEEKYRYVAENPDGGALILAFLEEGKIEYRKAAAAVDEGSVDETQPTVLTYTEDEEAIYVTQSYSDVEALDSTFKVPKNGGYFHQGHRSDSVAKHSYDLLRFTFENSYGLLPQLYERYNVSSFDALVEKANLKERLLSNDSLVYDEALCEILLSYIDDGHTKYIGRSLFSGLPTETPIDDMVNEKTGSRRGGLFEYKDAYGALRTQEMTKIDPIYEDPTKQLGLFIEDKTAVIRFDAFLSNSNTIDSILDGRKPVSSDIATAMNVSTADGFYLCFEELKNHSEVKNLVIDLTVNGGGASNNVPFLAAIWTKDPTFIIEETSNGCIKELHYEVDLNRNGVFGDEGDCYKDKYDIYLLTSEFSFSCGNALPTLAHNDGIPVIGKQSGGGSCPVGTFCDGSGTIYNTSMVVNIQIKDEDGKLTNNDAGVPIAPEYQLSEDSWYDLVKLNDFVNSLKA